MTWEANYKSMTPDQLRDEVARLERSQHFYPKYELYERMAALARELTIRGHRED